MLKFFFFFKKTIELCFKKNYFYQILMFFFVKIELFIINLFFFIFPLVFKNILFNIIFKYLNIIIFLKLIKKLFNFDKLKIIYYTNFELNNYLKFIYKYNDIYLIKFLLILYPSSLSKFLFLCFKLYKFYIIFFFDYINVKIERYNYNIYIPRKIHSSFVYKKKKMLHRLYGKINLPFLSKFIWNKEIYNSYFILKYKRKYLSYWFKFIKIKQLFYFYKFKPINFDLKEKDFKYDNKKIKLNKLTNNFFIRKKLLVNLFKRINYINFSVKISKFIFGKFFNLFLLKFNKNI